MQDVLRNQYRIRMMCKNVYKFARKQRSSKNSLYPHSLTYEDNEGSIRNSRSPISLLKTPRSASESSGQGRAKARIAAFRDVVGRLIKD